MTTSSVSATGESPRGGLTPPARFRFLHLAALTGFAVAQPLYGLLSTAPEFFGAHRSGPVELLLLVGVTSFAVPVVLTVAVSLLARLSRAAAVACHLLGVAALAALLLLGVLRSVDSVGALPILAAALVAGAGFGFLYLRSVRLRSFMTWLSVSALFFPALFLLRPPISALLLEPAAEGERSVRSESNTPVVLIVFDELPLSSLMRSGGHINQVLYPRFAELAETGDWFPKATTVSKTTSESLPAILTGRYPEGKRPAVVRDSLFSLVARSHELVVYQQLFAHCPHDLCDDPLSEVATGTRIRRFASDIRVIYQHLYWPAAAREGLPPVDMGWADFQDRRVEGPESHERIPFIRRFVDAIGSTKRPALYFLHPNFPHSPWGFLPSGREYGPLTIPVGAFGISNYTWSSEEHFAIQGWQRHLLQVGFADRLLGEVIDKLKTEGIFEEALIVVTADHGVSFVPGSNYRTSRDPEIARDIFTIPLFVKAPHQTRGRVRREAVETVDIVPTVADFLDVLPPWPVDGVSIREVGAGHRDAKSVFFDSPSPVRIAASSLQVDATVARKEAIFGQDENGFYAFGPLADLIGRSPDDLGWRPADWVEATLEGEHDYETVEPESSYVPAFVVGWLESSRALPLDADLAIAVNGTIRAGAKLGAATSKQARFAAMVPEGSFVPGPNRIDVFIADRSSGEAPLLRAARPELQTYSLTEDGIEGGDGTVWLFGASALQGTVEQKDVQLVGWAADRESRVPAERILLFADGEFVLSARLIRATPRLEKLHGESLSRVGFRFAAPYARVPQGAEVRLFAIAGDSACELRYAESFRLGDRPRLESPR